MGHSRENQERPRCGGMLVHWDWRGTLYGFCFAVARTELERPLLPRSRPFFRGDADDLVLREVPDQGPRREVRPPPFAGLFLRGSSSTSSTANTPVPSFSLIFGSIDSRRLP